MSHDNKRAAQLRDALGLLAERVENLMTDPILDGIGSQAFRFARLGCRACEDALDLIRDAAELERGDAP